MTLDVDSRTWQPEAACPTPELGTEAWLLRDNATTLRLAQQVCVGKVMKGVQVRRACPVRALCLSWAQRHPEAEGLYGGRWFGDTRLCEQGCGLPCPRHSRYCSVACARAKKTTHWQMPRECRQRECAQHFTPHHPTAAYCSDGCRTVEARRLKRNSMRKVREDRANA